MTTEEADEAAERVTAFLDHMFTPDGKGDVIRAYTSGGVQYLLTEDDLRALLAGYKEKRDALEQWADAPAETRQLFDRHDPAQVYAMRQALLQAQVRDATRPRTILPTPN